MLVSGSRPFLYPQRWAPGEVENAVQRGIKKPATIQKSGFSYGKKHWASPGGICGGKTHFKVMFL